MELRHRTCVSWCREYRDCSLVLISTHFFSSAKIEAVNEALKVRPEGAPSAAGPPTMPRLTLAHVYAALDVAKPSVSQSDERRYSHIFAPYRPQTTARGTGNSSATAELPHQRWPQAGSKVALA